MIEVPTGIDGGSKNEAARKRAGGRRRSAATGARRQLAGVAQPKACGMLFFFCDDPQSIPDDFEVALQTKPDDIGPNLGQTAVPVGSAAAENLTHLAPESLLSADDRSHSCAAGSARNAAAPAARRRSSTAAAQHGGGAAAAERRLGRTPSSSLSAPHLLFIGNGLQA